MLYAIIIRMKKLSVIIPVYNVEEYLEKCLDSAIEENAADYEIICVNDGSTDSSPDILRSYAEKYPDLIRVISTENRGLGSACNTGIREASGEYVVFLDSDDCFSKNAVPEMLTFLDGETDMIVFDFMSVSEKGKQIGYTRGVNADIGTFSLESYPQFIFEIHMRCNKIYRRSLFTDNGFEFPSRVWFEDYDTVPKLYIHCRNIRYANRCWYRYLQRSTSITHGTDPSRNTEIFRAVDSFTSYYREKGLYDKYRREIEFSVFYNVFLTSVNRVNLIDRTSIVQDQLAKYFLVNFPGWRSNQYIRKLSPKLRMLSYLIYHRYYGQLNAVLTLNNRIKGK